MEGVLWILSIFSTVPCVRVCTKVVFKSVYLYFAFYLKYLLWNLLFRFFIIIIIFCVPFLSFTYFTVLWLESLTLYLIRIVKKAFFLDFFLILEGKHAFFISKYGICEAEMTLKGLIIVLFLGSQVPWLGFFSQTFRIL